MKNRRRLGLFQYLGLFFAFYASFAFSQNSPTLGVDLQADRQNVLVGETVVFRVTIAGQLPINSPLNVAIQLPLGARFVQGSAKGGNTQASQSFLPSPVSFGSGGAQINQFGWVLQSGLPSKTYQLEYAVRFLPASVHGDGKVKVMVNSPSLSKNVSDTVEIKVGKPNSFLSDTLDFQGCVVGTIWLDCNDDKIKTADEPVVPGVRLYLEDGTMIMTDKDGAYTMCGIRPATHVIKVDKQSLPVGVLLDIDNARNVDNPYSKFLDVKKGELHRADFRGVGCSVPVINRLLSRSEAAQMTWNEEEKSFQGKSFVGGVSFNSDEDRLRNFDPCQKDDGRVLCVEKVVEAEKLARALAEKEAFTQRRELEVDLSIQYVMNLVWEEMEDVRRQEEERINQQKKLKEFREKEVFEKQKEAVELEKAFSEELVTQEKLIEKNDEEKRQEVENKKRILYQEATKNLKLNEVKNTDINDSDVPDPVMFDELLEPSKLLKGE